MLADISSATLLGVDGHAVDVQVHVSNGLPAFHVVGQPDAACRESRDRARAALLSSGFQWPLQRITVNLAPSELRKVGSGLDLAIAIGVLVATGVVETEAVSGLAFLGELGLDGSIRPVSGMVPLAGAVQGRRLVVPACRVDEAELVAGMPVQGASTVGEIVTALRGEAPWPDRPRPGPPPVPAPEPDLADVRGQPLARRALELAAAGGHHLLMVGPPGAGKTMLARRLAPLLPDLDEVDALDATRIHSAAGLPLPPGGLVLRPPFRAPHHGATAVSLIGGGSAQLRPGELSCAHGGVLFLDELGEFHAGVLDQLRQPLEEGVVRVARARESVRYPARFILVAAMNPCPCGGAGTPGACICGDAARARYARRLSGPVLDRFDLRVEVDRPSTAELLGSVAAEPTAAVRARVAAARARAADRGVRCNAQLEGPLLDEHARFAPAAARVLERELEQGRLTARGLQRIRRVARTIADLDGHDGELDERHVCSALDVRVAPFSPVRAA